MDVSTHEGLANHAESVSCYLHEYGRNQAFRSEYSKSFFIYLLAASWSKLHSRFRSWQALGFIRQLELSITGSSLEKMITEDEFQYELELGPGDRTLADFFSRNKIFLLAMVDSHCKSLPDEVKSRLSHLTHSPSGSTLTFNEFSKAAELARKNEAVLYTKDTVLDFHCLLYLSFLMAGNALGDIKDAHLRLNNHNGKKKPDVVETYKLAIKAAEVSIRFLVCMLSSSAFKSHMNFWTDGGLSLRHILPSFDRKREYMIFGKDRKIIGSSKMGPGPTDASPSYENSEDDTTEVREKIIEAC